MAKTAYTKLKCTINKDEVSVQIGENTIAVKQYLPINEKLELIGRVINQSHEEDHNYSNPVKVDVYTVMEIIFAYTDISFTDKQKEDIAKLYDQMMSSGIVSTITKAIPATELTIIYDGVKDTIEAVYKYQNSILGLLDTMKTDYSDLDFDAQAIADKISGVENLELIKEVMSKLG